MTQEDASVGQPAAAVEAPPPEAPRARTKPGARRSWGEMRVRVWWLCAAGLLVVTGYVVVSEAARALADRELVEKGVKVQATVTEIDRGEGFITRENYSARPDEGGQFALKFTLPGGQPHTVRGRLKAQRDTVAVGDKLPLFVDRVQPNRWTDRREMNWNEVFIGAYILTPAVALLAAVGVLKRMGVLKVWRHGEAVRATVVEVRNSPLAPLSRLVRMAQPDSRDARVFVGLIPVSSGVPEVGDSIWVVMPPGKPGKAIVAKLYQ